MSLNCIAFTESIVFVVESKKGFVHYLSFKCSLVSLDWFDRCCPEEED